ncbi:MFS transporter [Patescibacteria group bacterium]
MIRVYRQFCRLSLFRRKPYLAVFTMVAVWGLMYAIFEYYFPIVINKNLDSLFLVGLITSLMSLVSFFTFIPFGALARRSTLRRLLVIAMMFFLVVCALLFFVELAPLIILIGVALLYGVFFDLFDMAIYSYLFRHVKASLAMSKFALRDIFESIGLVIGYIIAGIFLSINFPWTLQMIIVLAVVMISMILLVLRREKPESSGEFTLSWKHTKKVMSGFRSNYGLLILWLMVAETIVTIIFFEFAPIYFNDRLAEWLPSDMWGGLIFAGTIIPFIFIAMPIAKKIKPRGLPWAIALGLAVLGAGFVGFSLAGHYIFELIIMVAAFIGYAFYWPAAETFYQRCSEQSIPDNPGEDVGIMNTALNIGYFIGPLLGGILLSYFYFPLVIQWGGFILIALAIVSFLLLRTPRVKGAGFLKGD